MKYEISFEGKHLTSHLQDFVYQIHLKTKIKKYSLKAALSYLVTTLLKCEATYLTDNSS